MKQVAKVTHIGAQAIDHQEPLLLFFGEGVTDGLREHSIIQKIEQPEAIDVRVGGQIIFGEEVYQITYVGKFVNQNLQTIEHVSFVFSEEPQEKMEGTIYLTPAKVPTITLGMEIIYQS
ncbi:PTS glucitol/sorbitol transporter subunit IIA [Enterococcus sp. LJL98]